MASVMVTLELSDDEEDALDEIATAEATTVSAWVNEKLISKIDNDTYYEQIKWYYTQSVADMRTIYNANA